MEDRITTKKELIAFLERAARLFKDLPSFMVIPDRDYKNVTGLSPFGDSVLMIEIPRSGRQKSMEVEVRSAYDQRVQDEVIRQLNTQEFLGE